MGFDVFGRAARSEKGEYFRNNIWWWHPLAEYVLDNVSIPERDRLEWHSNGGYEISDESARMIAERLHDLIAAGDVAEFSRAREKLLAELPDESCFVCDGSGRTDAGTCTVCEGNGHMRPWVTNYPFSVENVVEFATFCRESGGFVIC